MISEMNIIDLLNKKDDVSMSVSDLASLIKNTLEHDFSDISVKGEISGLLIHSSGHTYFSLKDDNAVIDCISWRGTKIDFKIENGMSVVCKARLTTYPMRSKYQIVVSQINLCGSGEIFKLLEERKKKLHNEGIFDKKRKIPYIPSVIGIITSPTGAVIRDIIHRLRMRMVTDVRIFSSKVQGDGAVQDIVNAIKLANNELASFDNAVIIIARGGGSTEDLWTFQEEEVARAVFASKIPIISAVGHETDTTLIDYAADIRAPTPTAAAEMVAPLREELNKWIAIRCDILHRRLKNFINIHENSLSFVANSLKSIELMLTHYIRRYDELEMRMISTIKLYFSKKFVKDIAFPARIFNEKRRSLLMLSKFFDELSFNKIFSAKEMKLSSLERLLKNISYEKVLERGFCIVENNNKRIKNKDEACSAREFKVIFSRNQSVNVIVNENYVDNANSKKTDG